jgi:hypothetical protein
MDKGRKSITKQRDDFRKGRPNKFSEKQILTYFRLTGDVYLYSSRRNHRN